MPDRLTGQTLVIASGHHLSLALLDGDAVVAEHHVELARGHSERLMPELRAMLAPVGGAGVRPARIVAEIGPGSFTGLRVGIAAGRALGLAWGCPVLGVRSTLLAAADAASHNCSGPTHAGRLLVALAAPRGQVWLEAFVLSGLTSTGAPVSLLPADAALVARDYALLAGTAGEAVADGRPFAAVTPRAAAVRFLRPEQLQAPAPLYVSPGEARAAA